MDSACSPCISSAVASEVDLLVRLDQVIAEYRHVSGALISVLQIAQGIFGYLPESALQRIYSGLGKSHSEVAGVVGFYSFFSTTHGGRHLRGIGTTDVV
jgi:NADH:ubiquinone oxidoreductase subunit E